MQGCDIRFFGKVLIDHLVFYVSNRHLSIQTLKIFLKYPTTQCTIVIAEGQRWSSTDLETYYQRYLGIKSKNKISVRWNNCFDIHWQIFKYIISLISPADEKMLKMPLNDTISLSLAMKATTLGYFAYT